MFQLMTVDDFILPNFRLSCYTFLFGIIQLHLLKIVLCAHVGAILALYWPLVAIFQICELLSHFAYDVYI